MFWNFTWIVAGTMAFLFVLVNLIRSFGTKKKGWQPLMFASLSCGAVAVLSWLHMISKWVEIGDTPAIYDVVPTVADMLSVAVGVGIILNLVVLIRNMKNDRNEVF